MIGRVLMLLTLFVYLPVSAGDSKGDGGGGIECPKQKIEILDLYEARKAGMGEPSLGDYNDVARLAKEYLQRLEVYSPKRAEIFRTWYESFETEAVFLDSVPIEDINDIGVELPKNCQWRQIINQNPLLLPPGKKYLVNRWIWEELSPLQKVSLIFHELFYRQSDSQTSKGLRYLNGLILTNQLNKKKFAERVNIFGTAGLGWMESQGLSFEINSEVTIHDEFLISARAQAKSSYEINDQKLFLYPKPVFFHPNGLIKELFISNSFIIRLYGQDLPLSCNEFSGEPLRFFDNGQIESGQIGPRAKPIVGPHFNLSFWSIRFDDQGRVTGLHKAYGKVLIDGHSYKIKNDSPVFLHPNERVKQFTWGESSEFIIWEQKIQPLSGYPLNFNEMGQLIQFVSSKDGRLQKPDGKWINFSRKEIVRLGSQ